MILTALMYREMTNKDKKSIVEKKGVEAIEEFAADKEVCSNALNALALMSDVGAAQKVVAKYGVSAILSTMRRHKEKEVLLYALKALNGLCEVREISEAVGREGGIPAVVEVWRLFAEEMVTRVSEATADELIACSAVQTVLEVLEQYASETLVMAALCELVTVMATNAQAKKRFLDEDVVMITTGGREDAEMIGSALHALMSLLSPPFDGDALQGHHGRVPGGSGQRHGERRRDLSQLHGCAARHRRGRRLQERAGCMRRQGGSGEGVLTRDQELSTMTLEVMKHYPFSLVVQLKALSWLASVSAENYTRVRAAVARR